MIESFIITLREGIEIALIIGILIVHLRNIKRQELTRAVFVGLGFAAVTSVVAAIVLQAYAIDSEVLEGYLMVLAAIFVTSMIVWMWSAAKRIRRQIESKVEAITRKESSWEMHAGILLLSFLLVVREGIETVIFLQAVAYSTNAWSSLFGTLFGLSAATIFAVLFIKGSVHIDVVRFLKVTAVVLMIFVAQLLVNGVHEFFEFGVLPPSPTMMGLVGPIVRHDLLFILAILSIPALMLIIPSKRRETATLHPRNRKLQLAAGVVSLSIVFFLGFDDVFSTRTTPDIKPPETVTTVESFVYIPIDRVDDGQLHRFAWTNAEGVTIRFFALRTGLGTYATAFDACRACFDYAHYYLENNQLVCTQCDAPVPIGFLRPSHVQDQVDESMSGSMEGNGCAPVFLPSSVERGEILISAESVNGQRKYFDYH